MWSSFQFPDIQCAWCACFSPAYHSATQNHDVALAASGCPLPGNMPLPGHTPMVKRNPGNHQSRKTRPYTAASTPVSKTDMPNHADDDTDYWSADDFPRVEQERVCGRNGRPAGQTCQNMVSQFKDSAASLEQDMFNSSSQSPLKRLQMQLNSIFQVADCSDTSPTQESRTPPQKQTLGRVSTSSIKADCAVLRSFESESVSSSDEALSAKPWELGVSVHFLETLMIAHPIDESWSLVDVKDNIIVPKTRSRKCAYVQLLACHQRTDLSRRWIGSLSHFVSHWWGYKFSDLVDMVRSHALVQVMQRQQDRHTNGNWFHVVADDQESFSDVGPFFFIDAFCINQHTMKLGCTETVVGYQELVGDLRKSLLACGDMIVCCERGPSGRPGWEYPAPFERIWCLFEIFQAIECSIPINVYLGRAARQELRLALAGDGIRHIPKALSQINCESALSSVPSDRQLILSNIRDCIGIELFNQQIRARLENNFLRVTTYPLSMLPVPNMAT